MHSSDKDRDPLFLLIGHVQTPTTCTLAFYSLFSKEAVSSPRCSHSRLPVHARLADTLRSTAGSAESRGSLTLTHENPTNYALFAEE